MNIETERQVLLERIKQKADPRHKKGMSIALPTKLKVYGVRVPHLRKMARAWQHTHKQVARENLMALVEALWAGESREERLLAIYLLDRYKRWIPDLTWAHFEHWRQGVDNWEVGDGLAHWVLAPWLLADPHGRLDHLRDLIADENIWSRRLALIATVPINRGCTGFTVPDLTLKLIDQVKEERHPMITKAVSWALRELTKTHPARVQAYLDDYRDVLAPHAAREVENKLRSGLKSGKVKDQDEPRR
jgi:3-methyladenine DNA glycosylase AlkD